MTRPEGQPEDLSDASGEALLGRAVGKYTLHRVIGRGGMGIVFEGQNTAIGKRVAVKVISADLTRNKDAVQRFQREAQAASAVESAHIVDIFDAGTTDDGMPFLVMELLRGEDLGHKIRRSGRLEVEETLHIAVQLLRGLARAHAAGIVHRDLKPDNVFLVDRDDDSAFVKILDFGISKFARPGDAPVQTLTKQGTVLGTPFYMAPEQAQGLSEVDHRSDLWSVGAILYECLSGRAPHTGASYEQVIVHICSKDAEDIRAHNPMVPEPIAKLIARALSRPREDRFGSAREFLDALVVASGGAVSLPPRSGDDFLTPARSSDARTPSFSSGVKGNSSGSREATSGAFEDTLEVRGGGPSRVGWSTSGRTSTNRERRRVIVVGATFLAIGVGAALYFSRGVILPSDPGGSQSASSLLSVTSGAAPKPSTSTDVTWKLRANVDGARFSVNGVRLAGGVLQGARGEKRRVLVEAEGYGPVEAVIELDPDKEPEMVTLEPHESAAPAGPSSTATAGAQGGTAATTSKTTGKPGPSTKPTETAVLPPIATTAVVLTPPTATATAKPTPTLTLRTD